MEFDPLYAADLDIFKESNTCKERCDNDYYVCYAKCNRDLLKKLNNEIHSSLAIADQILF